jgi:hypothetical protein
MVDETVAKLVV